MKVSKYLVRKNKTGSLNKPTNYTSLVKEKVEVEEIKRKEFSYENFENDFEYINDLYYATIENNFYYFSLPGDDPLIWNSNNVMREKYINNEVVEVDRAYQKKFYKLDLKTSSVTTEFSEFNITMTPMSELEKFINKNDKGSHFTGRIIRDDSRNWWALNTISSLFLMNRSEQQLVDYLSFFEEDKQKIIVDTTIKNIEKIEQDLLKHLPNFKYYFDDLKVFLLKWDFKDILKSDLKNKRLKF